MKQARIGMYVDALRGQKTLNTEMWETEFVRGRCFFNKNYNYVIGLIEERLRRDVPYADNKCRKARAGHVPFSKKQKKIMGTMRMLRIIYWKGTSYV